MIGVGILVTFRIAGPLYRFETHLNQIAAGEDPGECYIRKSDELHSMCAAINAAVATLSASKETEQDLLEADSEAERAA